jgi:hypothetical protein
MNTITAIKQLAATSAVAGTLGLAAIGGAALIIAAPANAAPAASGTNSASGTTQPSAAPRSPRSEIVMNVTGPSDITSITVRNLVKAQAGDTDGKRYLQSIE